MSQLTRRRSERLRTAPSGTTRLREENDALLEEIERFRRRSRGGAGAGGETGIKLETGHHTNSHVTGLCDDSSREPRKKNSQYLAPVDQAEAIASDDDIVFVGMNEAARSGLFAGGSAFLSSSGTRPAAQKSHMKHKWGQSLHSHPAPRSDANHRQSDAECDDTKRPRLAIATSVAARGVNEDRSNSLSTCTLRSESPITIPINPIRPVGLEALKAYGSSQGSDSETSDGGQEAGTGAERDDMYDLSDSSDSDGEEQEWFAVNGRIRARGPDITTLSTDALGKLLSRGYASKHMTIPSLSCWWPKSIVKQDLDLDPAQVWILTKGVADWWKGLREFYERETTERETTEWEGDLTEDDKAYTRSLVAEIATLKEAQAIRAEREMKQSGKTVTSRKSYELEQFP